MIVVAVSADRSKNAKRDLLPSLYVMTIRLRLLGSIVGYRVNFRPIRHFRDDGLTNGAGVL